MEKRQQRGLFTVPGLLLAFCSHVTVDDVGHGLEAAVRVPGRALGLPGRVLHLTHLVHHDERVEVAVVDPGERAAHREALALETAGRGGHGEHGTCDGVGGCGYAGQRQRVLDGHGGHVDKPNIWARLVCM